MATKRMFSKDIVGSDAFQDMPSSSQLLYFHLGMEADDDGFVGNPKKISRSIGLAEDDLKILLAKRFVLVFSSGVLVIKHHRINNNWDKYNCKRTVYMEEFNQLYLKENKAYTIDKTQGIELQSENSLKTVFRGEENKGDKKRIEEKKTPKEKPSASYLISIPQEDIDEFVKRFDIYPKQVISLGETLKLYCESKGKRYSNYKSFLLNAIKRDFKERVVEAPKKEVPEITEEQRKENIERLKEMKAKLFKK